ncbi:MAG: V-type ATP synthase subunit A [Candidatus Thermoplasmatota archaeon]
MVDEAEESISKIKTPDEDEGATGQIIHVAGPVVEADGLRGVEMYEVVEVGEEGLIGEVIELDEDVATIQVYEETGGVKPGEPVERTGEPLSLELGPGLIEQIYDGIQRPLESIVEATGDFITRGIDVSPLDEDKKWEFEPKAEEGEEVEHGDILGIVEETKTVKHKVMVPPDKSGEIKDIVSEGEYTINETIVVLETEDSEEEISMKQRWPVRVGRPIKDKKQPGEILVTGQRVLDTFFPLAKGGTAAIPGGFGTGKCVTGDTPVMFTDGLKRPIEEIYEEYNREGNKKVDGEEELIELDQPIEILSMDDGEIVEKRATCLYKGKTDSTVLIKTKSGREVELTPIHKLFVLTPDMEILEKPAGEIQEGDTLLAPRRLPTGGKTEGEKLEVEELLPEKRVDGEDFDKIIQTIEGLEKDFGSRKALAGRLNISEDVLTEYALGRNRPKVKVAKKIFEEKGIDHEIRKVKSERNSTPIKVPEKIDDELAELLGLLLGDGSLKPTSVHFYNNDEELLSRVEELFNKLFDVKTKREHARTVKSTKVNCKALKDFLVALGFPEKNKSRNCNIPRKVLKSDDQVVAAFIRGYYLADGGFSKYEIEISTSSEEMASDLTYALTRIDTPPRLAAKDTDTHKSYRIRISGEELENFFEKTSTDHQKYEKIKKYLEKETGHFRGVNSVKVSPELVRNKFEKSEITRKKFKENGIKVANYTTQEEKMSIPIFRKFSLMTADEDLKSIAENHLDHFLPDPVDSIEMKDETKDVFDLTVPDTNNFVGGNAPMILHNTVIQHQLAKWSDADIVVYVGCGERGNEMTEVLRDFPELEDPWTGEPLMKRTVLIANTSNMPVAAREASVFSGITIAEYYRDMGYNVALMADSTSRWAEALREISGRLEEMPGEEGFPAYLASELASFYERAGICELYGDREGSVSVIGAVSPSGGDFSEPVTQNTLRIAQVFWALDTELKNRRHFPAVDWLTSYSLYLDQVGEWWDENVNEDWQDLRRETMRLLEKESELEEIVQLVGPDALPPSDQFALQAARIVREDFLQQNAFHDVDTFCSPEKQFRMLQIIMEFYETGQIAIEEGVSIDELAEMDVLEDISRMSNIPSDDWEEKSNKVEMNMNEEFQELEESLELSSPLESGAEEELGVEEDVEEEETDEDESLKEEG